MQYQTSSTQLLLSINFGTSFFIDFIVEVLQDSQKHLKRTQFRVDTCEKILFFGVCVCLQQIFHLLSGSKSGRHQPRVGHAEEQSVRRGALGEKSSDRCIAGNGFFYFAFSLTSFS
jgi:hypothetical protein